MTRVQVTNPDRVMFPADGFTKADVVAHYRRFAAAMLPHLRGAPLTLERYPRGIGAEGFMQKNAPDHFPASIGRIEVPRRGGTTRYAVVHEAADIIYLANQGTVTFHAWTSRLPHLSRPDRVVFDLDPPEDAAALAREAAMGVGTALDRLGVPTVPVATGSKGYHVAAAIAPTMEFADVAHFAQGLAALLCVDHPDVLTPRFRIEGRRGLVFVDWLRNQSGSTTAVPWSLRARPGAPVAVPITWGELEDTEPDTWRLDTVADRLAAGDPLAALAPVELAPAAAQVAEELARRGLRLERFDRFRR